MMVDMSDTLILCRRVMERCSSVSLRAAAKVASQRNIPVAKSILDGEATVAIMTPQRNERL